MKASDAVFCVDWPCAEMDHAAFAVPGIDVDPQGVRLVLIAEVPPPDPADGLYAGPESLHAQTTLLAFRDGGLPVDSIEELLRKGVYLTTAVKCGKPEYNLKSETVARCSRHLEQELDLFPGVRAYLLMGDVAIRAFNEIARRRTGKRVIPAGSSYKLRGTTYMYGSARVFPSYLQAGKSFFIEQSKRRMIAEDIAGALAWTGIV
ncbi:MAG: uracil-DNA glycosylase family protein [Anaerolineae bacterium]